MIVDALTDVMTLTLVEFWCNMGFYCAYDTYNVFQGWNMGLAFTTLAQAQVFAIWRVGRWAHVITHKSIGIENQANPKKSIQWLRCRALTYSF